MIASLEMFAATPQPRNLHYSLAHNCASEVNGQKHRNFNSSSFCVLPNESSLINSANSVLRAYCVLLLHSCSRGIFCLLGLIYAFIRGGTQKGAFVK